jgi:hypothetical protein
MGTPGSGILGHGGRPAHRDRRAAVDHALMILPALVTAMLLYRYLSAHEMAPDFMHDFWVAGQRAGRGASPYAWTRQQIAGLTSFPYLAAGALLFVPFSLLPVGLSAAVFICVSMAGLLASLTWLGVRDWRVYSIVLIWWPVINAWQTGNLTLLLVCGTALAWRHRDSPVVIALLTAAMISVKPIVWPLGLWLLVTRRLRATALTVGFTVAINAVAWLALGPGQVQLWWNLVRLQTKLLYRQGYGLIALAAHLGASQSAGTILLVAVSAALAGVCWRLAGWHREREAFTVAVALMIVSSPLIDNHYFALMIVPLALARPSFDRTWLIPLLLWLCPGTGESTWQVALFWLVVAGITAITIGIGPFVWTPVAATPQGSRSGKSTGPETARRPAWRR